MSHPKQWYFTGSLFRTIISVQTRWLPLSPEKAECTNNRIMAIVCDKILYSLFSKIMVSSLESPFLSHYLYCHTLVTGTWKAFLSVLIVCVCVCLILDNIMLGSEGFLYIYNRLCVFQSRLMVLLPICLSETCFVFNVPNYNSAWTAKSHMHSLQGIFPSRISMGTFNTLGFCVNLLLVFPELWYAISSKAFFS